MRRSGSLRWFAATRTHSANDAAKLIDARVLHRGLRPVGQALDPAMIVLIPDVRGLNPYIPIGRAPEASHKVVDEGADLHRHQPVAGVDGIDRAGRRLPCV